MRTAEQSLIRVVFPPTMPYWPLFDAAMRSITAADGDAGAKVEPAPTPRRDPPLCTHTPVASGAALMMPVSEPGCR